MVAVVILLEDIKTMCDKLISVLITNFNYRSYLPDCVKSVKSQSKGNYEILIVDDGSTDGSEAVIKILQQNYDGISSVLLPINKGKLHALNRGIPLLRGEYTIILDADDILSEAFGEKMIPLLEANDSLGFCYSDCTLIDSNKVFIAVGRSTAFDALLIQSQSYIPECALTRTKILKAITPFDESIRVSTKHYKWKLIISSGYTGDYVAEPLFYYRMHDRNLSGIGRKILSEKIESGSSERLLSGYWGLS